MFLKRGVYVLLLVILLINISFSIVVRIGIYDDYPWEYSDNGKINGILPNIIDLWAKRNDFEIDYIYSDYDNLIKLLKEKHIDIMAGVFSKDVDLKNIDFIEMSTTWMILLKRSSYRKRVINIFDLRKSTIVTESDSSLLRMQNMFKKLNIKSNLMLVKTPFIALKYLKKGIADFALVDEIYFDKNLAYNLRPTYFQFPEVSIGFLFLNNQNSFFIKSFHNNMVKLEIDKKSLYYKDLENYAEAKKIKRYSSWLYSLISIFIIVFVYLVYIALFLKKKIGDTTKEIEEKNFKLIAENKKLQNLRKRILLLNKKVEKSYQKLDSYIDRLDRLYNIFSRIIKNDSDEEDISDKILNFAVDSIREANCGSISIKKEDKWVFLATLGHNKNMLNSLELKSQYFIMPEKTTLLRNIENRDLKIMPTELYQEFSKALIPIKETILAPIYIGNSVRGNLAIDISKNAKGSFSKTSLRIASNMSSICSAFLTMKSYIRIQKDYQREIALTLIKMLELFDPYTEGHSEFVAQYSENLARLLKLNKIEQNTIYWAGLLHDIGKIGVPKEILNKPGPLTKEEFDKIKKHPILGYTVISSSKNLKEVAILVRQHHERYDGKGYPDGLKGKEICLGAQIISIIDAWEAMISKRPYKEALKFDEAIEEIKRNLGTQFDPEIGKAFLEKMLRVEIEDIKPREEK